MHRVESDYTAVPTQANECQSPETADDEKEGNCSYTIRIPAS